MERKGKPYAPFEVLPKVVFSSKVRGKKALERGQKVDFDGDLINMASQRLQTFACKGTRCGRCGIEGKFFFKERHSKDETFHFNLYAVDPERGEVQMGRSLVTPKSEGGLNELDNWQPLCVPCQKRRAYPVKDMDILPHILLTEEGSTRWINYVRETLENIPLDRPKRVKLHKRADLLDDGDLLLQAEWRGEVLRLQLPPDQWRWVSKLSNPPTKEN